MTARNTESIVEIFSRISKDPLSYFTLYDNLVRVFQRDMNEAFDSPNKKFISDGMRNLYKTSRYANKIIINPTTPKVIVPPITAWYDTLQTIYASLGNKLIASGETFVERPSPFSSNFVGSVKMFGSGIDTTKFEKFVPTDFLLKNPSFSGGSGTEKNRFITKILGNGIEEENKKDIRPTASDLFDKKVFSGSGKAKQNTIKELLSMIDGI